MWLHQSSFQFRSYRTILKAPRTSHEWPLANMQKNVISYTRSLTPRFFCFFTRVHLNGEITVRLLGIWDFCFEENSRLLFIFDDLITSGCSKGNSDLSSSPFPPLLIVYFPNSRINCAQWNSWFRPQLSLIALSALSVKAISFSMDTIYFQFLKSCFRLVFSGRSSDCDYTSFVIVQ